MPCVFRRFALFTTTALAPLAPLAAAEEAVAEAPERDYLPAEIVVVGTVDGYVTSDGSTGTKTPTPLIDVPQTIAVITADQLQDQAITQLGDALRYVPGVSLETGEGHRDEIFIRGQESTADFYLDGLRDDAQYYRPLYNVERIEVLKGANALIFGRGGGGGVVNRVSKTARLGDSAIGLAGSVDSFSAFDLAADINQPLGDNVALRINAAYEEFDSHRDFYEGRFIGISPTITAKLGADTRLVASYTYDDDRRVTDRGIPSLAGLPLRGYDETFFGDPDFNGSRNKAHIARLRLEQGLGAGWSANASVQYANYDKVYANLLPASTNGTTVRLSGYEDYQDRENLIAQANLVGEFDTGGIGHTLLAGIEASTQDSFNGRRNVQFGTGPFTSTVDVPLADVLAIPAFSLTAPVRGNDSNLTVLSAYIQDQVAIGDHVELIAGLRWDRFDLETANLAGTVTTRVDEKVSPRIGLVVKPVERLSLYASYATSFLPQAGDQFFLIAPNDQAFEPEKFTNLEIGAKWLIQPELFFTAALFQLDRTNTKGPSPSDPTLVELVGESRVKGLELNLAGEILSGWQANIGYTYLDGEIRTSTSSAPAGRRLEQLPEHQFTAWNHVELSDSFGLGLGVIYQDEQFAGLSNAVTLPDYWRVDAAAYYHFNDRVTLQLNVENLFDETYYPSAHGDNNIQPAEPFSARIGVRLEL
ncbi:TonB-dependent siderophore receptor [Parerythrobacter aurantius]|uniref:TonB-dependent receptor n=1 Tax=Parerythrobacter aurantius TaxID=3127706 RepID=UPI003256370E